MRMHNIVGFLCHSEELKRLNARDFLYFCLGVSTGKVSNILLFNCKYGVCSYFLHGISFVKKLRQSVHT